LDIEKTHSENVSSTKIVTIDKAAAELNAKLQEAQEQRKENKM